MSQPDPITVYLDTQDYSRFGKVVDGKGTPEDEEMFERLKELRANRPLWRSQRVVEIENVGGMQQRLGNIAEGLVRQIRDLLDKTVKVVRLRIHQRLCGPAFNAGPPVIMG